MQSISLKHHLNLSQPLKEGSIVLTGLTGRKYVNKALYVPGYGMVPCSRKLKNNFSNNPKDLMLVISDGGDLNTPVTSDIWITSNNIVAVFNRDEL